MFPAHLICQWGAISIFVFLYLCINVCFTVYFTQCYRGLSLIVLTEPEPAILLQNPESFYLYKYFNLKVTLLVCYLRLDQRLN